MNYSGISECDVLNGTGFRVVLFVSGCSHRCYNCQNPKTWDKNFGHSFTEKTKEYLLGCLSKDYIDGITLTGGDPLYKSNLDTILSLIKEIRHLFPQKSIWLYTGFVWEDIMYKKMPHPPKIHQKNFYIGIKKKEIISLCDVVVDGKYIDEQRDITLKWRGSSNQRVIDIKQSLAQGKVALFCD